MAEKDGGPAFPREDYQANGRAGEPLGQQGMSLRDYFAAHALPGLLIRSWEDANGRVPDNVHALWAASAYRLADEMLKERSRTSLPGESK